jgi:hypothetical protein
VADLTRADEGKRFPGMTDMKEQILGMEMEQRRENELVSETGMVDISKY